MLNVNRLRVLREVAARGTMAKAAEAMYMTPSAISQQLAVLEREAGAPLLERKGRGVKLTDAGRRLLEHTEAVLAELESAEADLATSAVGVVDLIRVSAFPTAARSLLIPAIAQLQEAQPNLRISMIDLEPEESLPGLKADELDLVVTYEWDALPSLDDAGIERERLFSEPVYVALPAAHDLAGRRTVRLAELRDEEWIVGRDSTSMLDLVIAATRRAGYEPRTDFHSMDFEVILSAVSAGLGVALVPPLALAGLHGEIAVAEISGMSMHRNVYSCIRRGSGARPGIAVVLEALRDVSKRLQATVGGIRAGEVAQRPELPGR